MERETAGARGWFAGKVCAVTGAGQGIGRAVARRFAREGARVAVIDRSEDGIRRVVDELSGQGAQVRGIQADLTRYREAERALAETVDAFGRVDVLVNNVGGAIRFQPFEEFDEDAIRAEIERSLWPTLWCCRAVLPHMLRQGSGSIVNIGSNAPRGIYRVPYAAAKGGVFALTTSLALEVARKGIRVNCVAPGATVVDDRLVPRSPHAGAPSPRERQWLEELELFFQRQIPMGRKGTVEEQARVVAFIASDEASFITGQIISVAGGATVP